MIEEVDDICFLSVLKVVVGGCKGMFSVVGVMKDDVVCVYWGVELFVWVES